MVSDVMQLDATGIGIGLALIIQTGLAMYWAGGISSKVNHLGDRITDLSKQIRDR